MQILKTLDQHAMDNAAFGLRPTASLMGLHFNRALLGTPTSAFLPAASPATANSPGSLRKLPNLDHDEAKEGSTRTSTPTDSSPLPPQQEYKCPLCQETLGTQKEFTQHIRGHNEVKPSPDPNDPTGQSKVYFCCMCRKMLSSFSSLDRHMLVHSGERPFSCEKCGQTFTTNGNMHRHKRTHGSRDSRESDVSSGGSQTSQSRPSRPTNNPGTPSSNGPNRKRKASVDSMPPSLNDMKNGGHAKCPICPESFYSELSLESHLQSVHQGQPIPCDECSHVFPNFTLFKLHKNMYHPAANFPFRNAFQLAALSMGQQAAAAAAAASLKEEIVKKKEENVLDLSSPIKTSKPAAVAPAEVPKPLSQFTSIEQLSASNQQQSLQPQIPDQSQHEELHADENDHLIRDMKLKGEFPCRLCDAIFPNLRALKGHNKEHMDRPPYICNVGNCTYSSNDKSTLARHMRTHTGEKPFECIICNFGFTTKANCERHVKNKHGKSTREEVRDSIVIHESSEDTNDNKHANLNTSLTESNGSETRETPSPAKRRRHESGYGGSSDRIFAPYRNTMFRPNKAEDTKDFLVEKKQEAPLDLSRPNTGDSLKENNAVKEIDLSKSLAAGFPTGQMPFPFLLSHLANATGSFDWAAYLLAHQQQEALRRQREAEIAAMAATSSKDPATLLMHLSNLQSFQSAASVNGPLASSPEKTVQVDDKSDGSEGDYKMVIKNGVLMKKQKQRRYRTERPHECEHCNARFTLRSNMDRHIKQQHSNLENGKTSSNEKNEIEKEEEKMLIIDDEEEDFEEDEEEEEEGIDLSNLEALAKNKPFSRFFDTSDEEEPAEDEKKLSAYANAPNKIECPFCGRLFPWSSSMKRHILTHTGQKPFKCPDCPLWFTTKSNCDRHLVRKHGNNNEHVFRRQQQQKYEVDQEAGDEASSNEDEEKKCQDEQMPFKCYLCEDGKSSKEDALKHLQSAHPEDYANLLNKGAFDCNTTEVSTSPPNHEDDFDQLRGQFPDYTNRRVICLFCLRKFWSAEDLRRHVRTHTGEKPYECDICHRKFTLKHSMLRHRKKHDSGVSSGEDTDSEGGHSSSSAELLSLGSKNNMSGNNMAGQLKKKKPSLMDKINQLSSAANGTGPINVVPT